MLGYIISALIGGALINMFNEEKQKIIREAEVEFTIKNKKYTIHFQKNSPNNYKRILIFAKKVWISMMITFHILMKELELLQKLKIKNIYFLQE